jgi:hypothetical protein
MKRLSLNAEDFETLVSGGVVEQDGVQIILEDMGYELMGSILTQAIVDFQRDYKNKIGR